MDGSVKNNSEEKKSEDEAVLSASADHSSRSGLRHRVVKSKPQEVPVSNEAAMEDLEYNRNGGMKTSEQYPQNTYVIPETPIRNRDDDEIQCFPENTFSFLLVARYPFIEKARPEYVEGTNNPIPKHRSRDYLCIPFWSALSILILQILIYILALENATDFTDVKNPFSFPIDVDVSTRTAEFVAVMITVYTENNLIQGVDQIVRSHKALVEIPGVTVGKYYFSATTQVVVGLYGAFVTFIIIMQAEGVVDLLLDFTAMEFVAALDDAAFILALRGFFGKPMKKTAKVLKDAKYTPRDKRKWLRKWPLFVLLAAGMACYFLVRVMQSNRAFGENEIYVQFHDDVLPWLSTLSGVYIGCNLPSSDHSRIIKGKKYKLGGTIYTTLPVSDCQNSWKKEHGVFFYCDKKHWVFAVGENKTNPCENWAMKSIKPNPESKDEYDIMTHSSEIWLAQDHSRKSDRGVVEEIQFLAGFEPSQNTGQNCSVLASTGNVFSYPFYARLEESLQEKSFSSERPVYFAGDDGDREYIIYTGRRWVVVKASQIPTCVRNCKTSTEPCCKLDPYASNYKVNFISDPMDLRRIEDTWIPTSDLIWYRASDDLGNSSKPIVEKQSLVDQIDVIEALSSVGSFPTDGELKELIALHLQSARLSCFCDAADLDCEKNVACGADEKTVWIDLQTDGRPQDTYFVVAGNETWIEIEHGAALEYEFASVRQYVRDYSNDDDEGFTFLNKTAGYFDWQDVWKSGFDAKSNYLFTTCLPKNKCGFVYIEDSAGNGLTFPGRFNVYLNTSKVERVPGGRRCLFDLCQESVTCSDYSLRSELFNPEVECTDESVPIAVQFFKDTSLSLSESSEWLAMRDATGKFKNEHVEWEHLRFDAMRELWANVDLFVASEGFDAEKVVLSPLRTTTCMPKGTCAIVNFDILDVPFEKVVLGDVGFPFEPPIVIYNGTEISPGDDASAVDHCLYQFGDTCQTEIICSDSEIPRPYISDIECGRGEKSLAIEMKTDVFGRETSLHVTDLETWMNGVLSGTRTLNETGTFEWGSIRFDDFDKEGQPAWYSFDTCVPNDVCGVAVLGDTYNDGIVSGGMTLVYDNKEILFGPRDKFSTCVFQFGDCETQLTCYLNTNSTPPYNPAIECQSGTPLSFELRADCWSDLENTILVTNLDSWNQGVSGESFPSLDTEGFFKWGDFQISWFENGPFHRFSTCLPSDECGVVAVKDDLEDGLEPGGGFTLVYNSTEIIRGPIGTYFADCVFQFGACKTQVVCYDFADPPSTTQPSASPPVSPSLSPQDADFFECQSGKPLTFDLKSDYRSSSENTIVVTDLDSWNQGQSVLFPALDTTGYFTWGDFRINNFQDDSSNSFSTCVPDEDICAILAIRDSEGDGIFDGGITVVYNNDEIWSASQGDRFTDCVFQFGACETQVVCYDNDNPLPPPPSLPPFNPEINCPSGKSLAFDFKTDTTSFGQHTITVGDFYSWSRGILSDASTLSEAGYFEWDTVEISSLEGGISHRFSTCVPNELCGIVVLEDSRGLGMQSGDWFTVYYEQEEILAANVTNFFRSCQYKFGPCGQEAFCTESLPPPYNPEIECFVGKSLAFDFHSDYFSSENDLIVTDWDTWVEGLWANSSSVLTETGFFDWGTIQIRDFEEVSSHHFSTCVPNEVCGVVVLRDSAADGVFTNEGLRVVYDQQEILVTKNETDRFSFCEYQFGSCGQEAFCSEGPTLAPTSAF